MSEQSEQVAVTARGIGDNSGKKVKRDAAVDRLRSIVDRIERLMGERKALSEDINGIFAEAKSNGYTVKVLRQLIRLRAQDPAKVEEEETKLETYRTALK